MSDPLAPELFASVDPLALAGSRCPQCATVQFPPARQCAHCAAESPVPVTLPATGRIWSWTVQHFEPKAPYTPPATGFEPYAVGYVDLGEVLVETLLCLDGRQPAIGDEVHLRRAPVGDHFTYAFGA